MSIGYSYCQTPLGSLSSTMKSLFASVLTSEGIREGWAGIVHYQEPQLKTVKEKDAQSLTFLLNNISYIFSVLACRDPVLPSPELNRQVLTSVVQTSWKPNFNKYKWDEDWESDMCNKSLCPSPLKMVIQNLRYWSSDPRVKLSRREIISKEEVFLAAKFSSARGGAHVESGSLQQRLHTSWGIWKERKETMLKGCCVSAPTFREKKSD